MKNFTLEIKGTNPLLMHSSTLSNPLDEWAKAIKKVSGKRTKTEDDYEEMANLEFFGGMYFDPEVGPYLPGDNIYRSLWDAAKKTKQGVKVKEGLVITSDLNALQYDGPRTREELWNLPQHRHTASVKVGMARVTRTRPQFPQWSATFEGTFDNSIIDLEDLRGIAETSGRLIGLGDWRPRYGRFEVVTLGLV